MGRLAEALWGARQPGNPVNTLQTKVSSLRRALAAAEPEARRLVTFGPPGYALRADDVDVYRFRELAARARGEDDSRRRADGYRAALDLWRGHSAYADFGGEAFADPVAARLEEERLSVTEELVAARLALGEAPRLVGETSALVAAHPLRERLWAVHVRALYQAGRQGEALAALTEVRRRLADELGVDPGPELAELHGAVLRQDPSLTPRTAAEAGAGAAAEAGAVARDERRSATNLPAPLTPLVGRTALVADLVGKLRSARLVTLTGPGGVGKTRLAVEVAGRLVSDHADGVWMAELAGVPAEAAGEVEGVVARVLGIRDDRPSAPGAWLGRSLADRSPLLLLDNCEHVVDETADVVAGMLAAAPGVRVVATSREPLGVAGELVCPVPALSEESAAELFTARAAAAAPGTELDPAAVTAVCRRLDGLPLALELAATRVRALGARELAARLADRLAVLDGGALRGTPPRQRTLRAVIDWSWELLTPAERAVLRRLAVFPDGCVPAAAEQVCADPAAEAAPPGGAVPPEGVVTGPDVVGVLARLVDRSLVVRVDDGPTGRFRLLESVAEYALERLAAAGERDGPETRLVRWAVRSAEEAAAGLLGADQRRRLADLDAESGTVRAALEAARRHGLAEEADRLVAALGWYWFLRGRFQEGRRATLLAEEARTGPAPRSGEAPVGDEGADAVTWRGVFALLCGAPAPPDLDRSLTGNGPGAARRRWLIALAHWTAGDLPASERRLSAAPEDHPPGDPAPAHRWYRAAARMLRGQHALVRGDLQAAGRDGRACAEVFAAVDDGWGRCQADALLASLAEINGDYARAARLSRSGLETARGLGLWPEVADRLWALGRVEMLGGRFDEARSFLERARRVAVEHGYTSGVTHAEHALALCARRAGEPAEAEERLRPLLAGYREIDFAPGETLALAELGFVATGLGRVDEAAELHERGLALARALGDQRAVALAVEGLAEVAVLRGDATHAAELLGAAAAGREAAGAPLPDAESQDVRRVTASIRERIGEPSLAAALQRGRARWHTTLWDTTL
ncbi:AfsR/SARP family transcriptional regulator [Streptomyces durbertensis]|uniref:AfsR/SARP family transcriptional regulator n=1 Tax=Streptomyces durbertensis TaxID=2448886 RepID=A0ABR6EJ54_9ACTN|nr:AfsR/SARP family transcriptional regulator [Streptomyces durbertensis]